MRNNDSCISGHDCLNVIVYTCVDVRLRSLTNLFYWTAGSSKVFSKRGLMVMMKNAQEFHNESQIIDNTRPVLSPCGAQGIGHVWGPLRHGFSWDLNTFFPLEPIYHIQKRGAHDSYQKPKGQLGRCLVCLPVSTALDNKIHNALFIAEGNSGHLDTKAHHNTTAYPYPPNRLMHSWFRQLHSFAHSHIQKSHGRKKKKYDS